MKYSENLNLKLPEGGDTLEVSDLSENFETLDGAVGEAVKNADPYKVGDTLTTWRTDLGENWLLCNGDSLDPKEYQELSKVNPGLATLINNTRFETAPFNNSQVSDVNVHSYAEANGLQVYVTSYGTVFVSNDNFRTYDTIPNAVSSAGDAGTNSIFFVNNLWVVLTQTKETSSTTAHATKYCVTDNPRGPWTEYQFPETSVGIFQINNCNTNLIYQNNMYYLIAERYISSGAIRKLCVLRFNQFPFAEIVSVSDLEVPSGVSVSMGWRQTFVLDNKIIVFQTNTSTGSASYFLIYDLDTLFFIEKKEIPTTFDGITISNVYSLFPCHISGKFVYFVVSGVKHYIVYSNSMDGPFYLIPTPLPEPISTSYVYQNAILGSDDTQYVIYNSGGSNTTHSLNILPKLDVNANPEKVDMAPLALNAVNKNSHGEWFFGWLWNNQEFMIPSEFPGGSTASYPSWFQRIPLFGVPQISGQCYTYIKAKEDTPNANQQADVPAP